MLAALLLSFSASAQDWRERVKLEKIAFLTSEMDLTSSEAEKFWPIYNQAEAQKSDAFEKMNKALSDLRDAIKEGKDDSEVEPLLREYLELCSSPSRIDEEYISKYQKVISIDKIARLYVGEEKFRRQQIHRLNDGRKKGQREN